MVFPLFGQAVVAIVATAVIAGCGTPPRRDQGVADEGLAEHLAFLRKPGVSRSAVEARLGPPQTTFEGGQVVGYRCWDTIETLPPQWGQVRPDEVRVWTTRQPDWDPRPGHQLMIEYDAHGKVRRHTLLEK